MAKSTNSPTMRPSAANCSAIVKAGLGSLLLVGHVSQFQDGFGFELSFTAMKPPVRNGIDGVSPGVSNDDAMFYYSITRMGVHKSSAPEELRPNQSDLPCQTPSKLRRFKVH